MLGEFESACAPGSTLTLMATIEVDERERRLSENGRDVHKHLQNIKLEHFQGDPTNRRTLEQLPIESYDSIIVVADQDHEFDPMDADGHAIATLLLIRDIRRVRAGEALRGRREFEEDGKESGDSSPTNRQTPKRATRKESWWHLEDKHFALTSEVLDIRSRHLIEVSGLADYVMSNKLVASAIAMVSEDRRISGILKEILTSEGVEIYLRPLERYLTTAEQGAGTIRTSFWELTARTRDRGEVLLGYKVKDRDVDGVVLNPADKERKAPWDVPGIDLVVLAED